MRNFSFSLFTASVIVACFSPFLVNAQAVSQSQFQFQFSEKPGRYAVGFKVVEQYDRSRNFQTDSPASPTGPEGSRPLQTLVWYPAKKSSGPAMTLGEYGALIKTETTFGHPVEHGKPQAFVDSFMQGTTGQHTWAIRDAGVQAGRYPVVIYAPSLNAPATENIELCEYLSSQGFVVIATPSMGASN